MDRPCMWGRERYSRRRRANGPLLPGRAVPDPEVLRPPCLRAALPYLCLAGVQDAGRISQRRRAWGADEVPLVTGVHLLGAPRSPLVWGKIYLRSLRAAGQTVLPGWSIFTSAGNPNAPPAPSQHNALARAAAGRAVASARCRAAALASRFCAARCRAGCWTWLRRSPKGAGGNVCARSRLIDRRLSRPLFCLSRAGGNPNGPIRTRQCLSRLTRGFPPARERRGRERER